MQTLEVPEGSFEDAAGRLEASATSLREALVLSDLQELVQAALPGSTTAPNAVDSLSDNCEREIIRVADLLDEAESDCYYVAVDLNEVDERFEYAFEVSLEW